MKAPQKSRLGKATRSLTLVLLILLAAPCLWLHAAVKEVAGGVQFLYDAPDAQSVSVAGSFNEWNTSASPMSMNDDGIWTVTVKLPPGKHQYKFVVDGNWYFDPDHSNLMDDGYGGSNSLVEIDGKGKMVAASQVEFKRDGIASMINPKVFFNGRYYAKYIFEKEKDESRYMLDKPLHVIDLGLKIRFNDQFEGYTVMNINNTDEGTDMWKTHLTFKRTYLKLKTEYFKLTAFDKYGFITLDDPLHMVGDIGRYGYAFGYDQRGVYAKTADEFFDNLMGSVPIRFEVEGLYSDDAGDSENDTGAGRLKTSWLVSQRENNEKTLRLGGTMYGTRISSSTLLQKHDSYGFDIAYEHSMMGSNWKAPMKFMVDAEYYSFENRDNYKNYGQENYEYITEEENTWMEGNAGWFGLQVDFPAALKLNANVQTNTVEWTIGTGANPNGLVPNPETTKEEVTRNRIGFGADFEAGNFTANIGMKYWTYEFPDSLVSWYDYYQYMERTDGNGRWFQRYSDVPFNRYTVLGYEEALTWNLSLGYKFDLLLPIDIDWDANFTHQGFMREAKFIENVIAVGIHLTDQWMIWSSTRVPYYNDPYMGLETDFGNDEDVWVSNYSELAYILSDQVRISFGWGVNPRALNAVTDEFYNGGRDEFLTEASDYEEYTESAYLGTGEKIRQAEQALENEKRFMLEATLRF